MVRPCVRRFNGYVTIDHRVVAFIAVLIAVVWAFSACADAFMHTFTMSPGVQAVMMSMSGALFGSLLRRDSKEREQQPAEEEEHA